MLYHVKYGNSNFMQIKKSKYYLGAPKLKENGSEYSLLEKIYNEIFSFFWSIYTNAVCSLMQNTEIRISPESKKSKYDLGIAVLKTKFL